MNKTKFFDVLWLGIVAGMLTIVVIHTAEYLRFQPIEAVGIAIVVALVELAYLFNNTVEAIVENFDLKIDEAILHLDRSNGTDPY
ncbi:MULTISPECIES: hypothetical protein [Acidobacteriaceae]|uniref:hypothetical protein n=1 Tax=Acidobacteriaceae TaxID=204434 RepID=UPI00131C61EA|nr:MULTISPECIES: hypothetical protein [Acidobacteriaceae]MDW5266929.1 hypothetical protein [Edaphobacter sp.]